MKTDEFKLLEFPYLNITLTFNGDLNWSAEEDQRWDTKYEFIQSLLIFLTFGVSRGSSPTPVPGVR